MPTSGAMATTCGSTCRSRMDERVNGAKVRVPTVDGAVMMTVKPGTSGGTVLRLKGKGFSRKDGTRGDQLVTLEIHCRPMWRSLPRSWKGGRTPPTRAPPWAVEADGQLAGERAWRNR
jgi:hypothetical protein